MHSYYMKKEKSLKKGLAGFMKLIKEELEEDFNLPYNDILEEIWKIYFYDIAEHFPYVGGDSEKGTSNLTGAFYFIAMGEAGKSHGMSLERCGYLTNLCYFRYFDRMPGFIKKLTKKSFDSGKLMTKMLSKEKPENENGFNTVLQEPTKDYHLIYHITKCPLADLANKLGYGMYMPYICNLDYAMFYAVDVCMEREKTCASGDSYCDFKFTKNKKSHPYWPCNSLNKDNLLK